MRKRILRVLHPANEAVYVVDSMPLPICRQALADVKAQFNNCILLGDKGYRSTQKQYELFEYAGIELHVPYKYNETAHVDYPANWARIRKRIEVVF